MIEHLPECCFAPHACDVNLCQRSHELCICLQLRACEERVLEGRPDPGISEKQAIANHSVYQNGYEQGKHDCASTHAIRGLKDMNRIAARGYDEGQRDAIAEAVQRVGSLWGFIDVHGQMGKPGVKWVDLNLVIGRIESKGISDG